MDKNLVDYGNFLNSCKFLNGTNVYVRKIYICIILVKGAVFNFNIEEALHYNFLKDFVVAKPYTPFKLAQQHSSE